MNRASDLSAWRAVPEAVARWLDQRESYGRLYKLARELPGLSRVRHSVHCLPARDALAVSADVNASRAGEWTDLLEKRGVTCLVTRPYCPRPPGYGLDPWMMVKRSYSPRRRPREEAPFASPEALAAALAGSVLWAEQGFEFQKTLFKEARAGAEGCLGRRPRQLVLPETPQPVFSAGDFADRVWADPFLSPALKAAAAGLVSVAGIAGGPVSSPDLIKAASGLGGEVLAASGAAAELAELTGMSAAEFSEARDSGEWAARVAAVVPAVYGL